MLEKKTIWKLPTALYVCLGTEKCRNLDPFPHLHKPPLHDEGGLVHARCQLSQTVLANPEAPHVGLEEVLQYVLPPIQELQVLLV